MAHLSQEFGPWFTIEELGAGGQGAAFKVVKYHKKRGEELEYALRNLSAAVHTSQSASAAFVVSEILRGIGQVCVLKVLHSRGNDEAGKKANARMRNEIAAMERLIHPHLLRLVDHDRNNHHWYVTEYQPNGSLSKAKDQYTGKALKALRDLRGVVEGVALIHEAGCVHRDIKPENIFLSATNRLVLGDFGLIFFADAQHSRVSDTLENVGSRDWMPLWAHSMRVEEVRPSFDIYSLGKTLYSMVSPKPHLRGWYHYEPEFDLPPLFTGDLGMEWINHILEKSVVSKEDQVQYKNAGEMLVDFERAIGFLANGRISSAGTTDRRCAACGLGIYQAISKVDLVGVPTKIERPIFGVLTCERCGHSELHAYKSSEFVPWKSSSGPGGFAARVKERKMIKRGLVDPDRKGS